MEFREMISPQEAEALIGRELKRYAHVSLPLSQCAGRILRAPILADRAQPPFDRVAMDGIAIAYEAYARGLRRFAIEGMQKAGEPQRQLVSELGCLEVMTGAVLPRGTDCVIPIEELTVSGGVVSLREKAQGTRAHQEPSPYRHVHRAGSDCAAGESIVPAGSILTSPHLGAAAAFGFSSLQVAYTPSVSVVATGDELVDPNQEPAAHQIRRSNPYAIEAALRQRGLDQVTLLHAPDDRGHLRKCMESTLEKCEVLILTGGVSMGKTDYVPEVLAELGIRPCFHRIRQRPGKPFWFGMGSNGVPVFALPGNPASVLVCLHRYVLPALSRAMGGNEPLPCTAVLERKSPAPGSLTHFRPVTVKYGSDGRLRADFVVNQGSGDFSGWARADGFVELDAGDATITGGSSARFWSW